MIDYDSSLDSKIGIFLGFAFVVFVQVILLGAFVLSLTNLELGVYAIGTFFLFLSIFEGLRAYLIRGKDGYPVGADISEILETYADNIDYETVIQDSMFDAFREVLETAQLKRRITRFMAAFFIIGIALLTSLSVLSICNIIMSRI